MTIHLRRGIRSKPNEATGWIEHEYNGNTFIEFVHPDEKERDKFRQVIKIVSRVDVSEE